jgi:tyrosyl-tRNA synthetase
MDMKNLDLVKRNSTEIIGEDKLKDIKRPVVYCGYETSGEIHLGHLVTITKLLDLQNAGFKVKILFADWHTWLNKKGDWDFINEQVKIWKKGFKAAGLAKAEFVVGSSFQRKPEYFDDVLTMALETTINRAVRSMQMVARDIDNAKVSQVFYPFMQIADMKHLKVNVVASGIEQRKIHMMGADGLLKKIGYETPVFIHTPLINSLKGPGSKMSSSVEGSFISIRDSDEKIIKKINKAHCPEKIVKDNPIVEIIKLIIFPRLGKKKFEVKGWKPEDDKIFESYDEFEDLYERGFVWPSDLKKSVSKYLIEIISPIRKSFK